MKDWWKQSKTYVLISRLIANTDVRWLNTLISYLKRKTKIFTVWAVIGNKILLWSIQLLVTTTYKRVSGLLFQLLYFPQSTKQCRVSDLFDFNFIQYCYESKYAIWISTTPLNSGVSISIYKEHICLVSVLGGYLTSFHNRCSKLNVQRALVKSFDR